MPLFNVRVLTKLIDEIDDLLNRIDDFDRNWTSSLDKLKASVDACDKAADDLEKNLSALMAAIPKGPYDKARQGAKDTIALVNQGRGVFQLDEDLEPIAVQRSLSDALTDLEGLKKVQGLEKAIPRGLWTSVDKFLQNVEAAAKLQQKVPHREDGEKLRKDATGKLQELVKTTKQLRVN